MALHGLTVKERWLLVLILGLLLLGGTVRSCRYSAKPEDFRDPDEQLKSNPTK